MIAEGTIEIVTEVLGGTLTDGGTVQGTNSDLKKMMFPKQSS